MRRLLLGLLTLGVVAWMLAAGVGPASAHGDLVKGSPGPGDAVAPGGTIAALQLSSVSVDAPAYVAVLDADDNPIAVGEPTLLADGLVCVRTEALEVGIHTVEYAARSEDGHSAGGRYAFEVTENGDQAQPGLCAEAELAPADQAQTLAEMTAGGEFPGWVIPGLVVLAALSAAGVVWRIRKDGRAETRACLP